MRKILSTLLLLLAVLSASADAGGFYYKNIKYEAVVHKNNVWDVTETFDLVFTEPRHGFYRYIPESFYLRHYVDGELQLFHYYPQISEIAVPDYEFALEEDNDNTVIKIGSENETVVGDKRYVITYTYQYPDDRVRDKDYLFHTILGTDFNQKIQHFSFKITFDKPLPANVKKDLKEYGGEYGSTDTINNAKVTVIGNVITGEADSIAPNHGITLYCDLPEGYYEGVEELTSTPMMLCFFITLLLIAIILVVAISIHHNHITKQIEFYPPDGISSAEVGTIIDDSVDPVDIASLIPWFASKGYLTIKEVDKKGIFNKSTVLELTRRNSMPQDAPQYQKKFWDALFDGKQKIRLDQLEEQPDKMKEVVSGIEGLYTGTKGAEDDHTLTHTSNWIWLYALLVIFSTLTLCLASKADHLDGGMWALAVMGYGAPFAAVIWLYYYLKKGEKMRSSIKKLFINIGVFIVIVIGYAFIEWIFVDNDSFMDDMMLLIMFAGCTVAALVAGRFVVDTPYRVQMMGKLLGLKEFIKTAEKPRLESLLQDDPEYFYKIMPYAMVFDLTDKWADQFKGINMEQPSWYDCSTFSTFYFTNSMSTLCSSASSAITTVSHDSSSSSGGAFGGGFSGGGGGGGGGGSW